MKKSLLAFSLLACCASAMAEDGVNIMNPSAEVKFHGRIIDAACTLSDSVGGSPVELGTYPIAYFKDTTIATSPVEFNLIISGCHLVESQNAESDSKGINVEKATLTFEDPSSAENKSTLNGSGLLASYDEDLGDNEPAKGIGVMVKYKPKSSGSLSFQDNEYNVIDSEAKTVDISQMDWSTSGDNSTIPFQAAMKKASASTDVNAGTVRARMKVTLSYK